MEKSMATTNEKVSNHIPGDLAFSILSKLPLKSLKRFGCVCKSWALLFENPHFMNMYRNNFISNDHSYYNDTSLLLQQTVPHEYRSVLYLLSGEKFENEVKLDWPPPFQGSDQCIHILGSGSINGTLCLYQGGHTRVVLWNLTTKEFKVLPPSPAESVPLPYDGSEAHLHGFGYDHVRDDYKVIWHVVYFTVTDFELEIEDVPMVNFHDPLCEIYSLRSNSWRKLDVDMPTCFVGVEGVRVYMDEVCHWWGESKMQNDDAYLVSFNLSNETFLTTPIPSDMDDSLDFGLVRRHLVVLNGSIALISSYVETTTFHISILGELGVKESWTKLFFVGPLLDIDYPIGVGKKGSIFFRKKR